MGQTIASSMLSHFGPVLLPTKSEFNVNVNIRHIFKRNANDFVVYRHPIFVVLVGGTLYAGLKLK